MTWLFTFGRKYILKLANKYIFGVNLHYVSWSPFYIFDNSVFSFIRLFKGGNNKLSKEIVLLVKGVDPESKAEDINGNACK